MGFDRGKADPEAVKDVASVFKEEDALAHASTDSSESVHMSEASQSSASSDNTDVVSNASAEATSDQDNDVNSDELHVGHQNNGPVDAGIQVDSQKQNSEGDVQYPNAEEAENNQPQAQPRSRAPSLVPTEIVPEPQEPAVPFQHIDKHGVIVRDYAFHPTPLRPPLMIFPILTSYIWFHYNRWRNTKQKPRILLNAWQSAFTGCELVYLMYFKWISMKEISWRDARDWFGQGLIHLYEHPRDVDISYGAKRPSPKSPLMRQWFSRFSKSKTLESNAWKCKPQRMRRYERNLLNFYGPFGEEIHRYFPTEETVVFWPLYEYLIGKGPRPPLSEKMEKVFEPVLNCHGGDVGGRGTPYERPRDDQDEEEPRESTEPEEVDVDPLLIALEYSNLPAFGVYRRERYQRKKREQKRLLREAEEAREKEKARRRRKNHKWTHKKTHKADIKAKATRQDSIKQEIIDIDVEPGRRCTRSMVKNIKEAKISGELPRETRRTDAPTRKDKGKGKAKAKAESISEEDVTKTTKRKRCDDDEESVIECFEDALLDSEPGPSSRPIRHVRRRVEPSEVIEPALSYISVNDNDTGDFDLQRSEAVPILQETRGTKRGRSLAPEPSDGLIDALKRRRLDEEGASERLVTPRIDEESMNDARCSAQETVRSSTEDATEEPEAVVPVQSVAPSSASVETAQTAVHEGQQVASAPQEEPVVTANQGLAPVPEAEAEHQQVPQPPPPPPPADQLMPPPPPPQVPHAPRPLRRTETTLFLGRIYRPNW